MKRVLITAPYSNNGEIYSWLIPVRLENELLKAISNPNELLAYDRYRVVKVVKIDHFKQTVAIDDFIPNYHDKEEFSFLDDLDDLISKLTKEDKEKIMREWCPKKGLE